MSTPPYVDSLFDQSGNKFHAAQSIQLYKPVEVLNSLNGHATCRFNKSYLSTAVLKSFDIRSEFVILKREGPAPLDYHCVWRYPNYPIYQLEIVEADNLFRTNIYGGVVSHNVPFDNGFQLITRTISLDSTSFRKNSVFGTSAKNQLIDVVPTSQSLLIGAADNTVFLNGDIAEIIIYDTILSAPQITQVEQYLYNKYGSTVSLGTDVNNAGFCKTILNAGSGFAKYTWSTGESTQTINVSKAGSYWVDAINFFDQKSSDTIKITYPTISMPLKKVDTICFGAQLTWDTKLNKSQYVFQWQDNSSDSIYSIDKAGKYFVKITDTSNCSIMSDTVRAVIDDFSTRVSLGNDTTFCSGNKIRLKSGGSEAVTFKWSDNSTDSILTISNSGEYKLTISDVHGCSAIDSMNVVINGIAPKAAFMFSGKTCGGDSISFADLSVAPSGNVITNWAWNFGDTKKSFLQNPKHLFQSPDTGTFNIKLSVSTDVGCFKDTTIGVHLYPKPVVNFSNSVPCDSNISKFSNLTNLGGYVGQSYSWNFGDALSGSANTSTAFNPTHSFTVPGISTTKLIVFNNKGCSDSLVRAINVLPTPRAAFSTSLTCEKQKVIFTDNSSIASPWIIQTYKTDFGDLTGSSTLKNPSHTYTIIGPYKVKYIISSNNGCSDTLLKTINVYSKPFARFGMAGPFCQNNVINFKDSSVVNGSSLSNWKWTIDGAYNSVLQNTTSTFSTTGSHSIKLAVTSAEGCKDSITKPLVINPLPVSMFSFTPIFGDPPLKVDFTNLSSGANSALWYFGDATSSLVYAAPTHVYQDSGVYDIKLLVTDNNGCIGSSSKNFHIQYAEYCLKLLQVKANVDADNFLNVTVSFGNSSTRPIASADIIVDVEGESGFKENWTGYLNLGSIITYTLKTAPRLNTTNSHNYICVKVKRPNGFSNCADEQKCIGLKSEQFILPEPSPNPVTDYVRLPVLMPSDEMIKLEVYDKMGKSVSGELSYALQKGFNSINYVTSGLDDGIYTYRISYGSVSGVKRFVKLIR